MMRARSVLLAIAAVGLGGRLHAAQAAQPLSLSDAEQRALQNHPQVIAGQYRPRPAAKPCAKRGRRTCRPSPAA